MGRPRLYDTEQLLRFMHFYVESLDESKLLSAKEIAVFINKNFNLSPPVRYYHFTRDPKVMEEIHRYNQNLEKQITGFALDPIVMPEQILGIDEIISIGNSRKKAGEIVARVNTDMQKLINMNRLYATKIIEIKKDSDRLKNEILILKEKANADKKQNFTDAIRTKEDMELLKREVKKLKTMNIKLRTYIKQNITDPELLGHFAAEGLLDSKESTHGFETDDDIQAAVLSHARIMQEAEQEAEQEAAEIYSATEAEVMMKLNKLKGGDRGG